MESIKEAVEYFHKGGLVMWPIKLLILVRYLRRNFVL